MTGIPLTPVDVERKLRQLVNDLAKAQAMLRDARDVEVATKHAYERAHRVALLAPDTPKVTRGGWTTAERDAYVDERCGELRERYEVAKVAREAAEDHLRTLRDQAMVVMSLGKSVNMAYAVAGSDG